jgi:Tol biopolymer transport system component
MQLEPGTSLAHYEVVAPLGAGGMGEVYRARDTKLGRDVAIKILPEEFTRDTERLGRFEREARVLASLHHPNIASIHGIEESGGRKFLVMQLAEGEDLTGRLTRGAIPVDEALPIAREIAAALDVAHERGVIHRDLKPANIRVGGEGHVTILDFGLAKAMDIEEGDSDLSNSPTMVRAATHAGVILGTAAYMSPEQARGKKVDKRADIWAFGVVLWEMLTGRRLFLGETVSDTLAAVLTKEADLSALPAETPASIRKLVARCLERDPRRRLRDIGEATIAIDDAIAGVGAAGGEAKAVKSSRGASAKIAWTVAAVAVIVLVAALLLRPGEEPVTPVGLSVLTQPVPGGVMSSRRGPAIAISPDGRAMVFVAREARSGSEGDGPADGASERMLWLRRTGDLAATPVPGTEGALAPFFSPDSRWIGFFSPRALMKVAVEGGSPLTLCETDGSTARGGTWGRNGVIVFAPDWESGLVKVSEDGGEPQPVTTLDDTANERSHRWPQFLPDGRSVLYMAQIRGRSYGESHIKIVDLESGNVKSIMEGGSFPRYISSGHLAWVKGHTLLVAAFDLGKMEVAGSPRPAVENVMSSVENEANDDGTAQYDFSETGVLVYRTGGDTARNATLALLDGSGKVVARGSRKEQFRELSLSPNGTQVAAVQSEGDVWIWDSTRDTMSRLTFEGQTYSPVWTPDGRSIVYTSLDNGKPTLRVASADGSGEPQDLIEGTTQQVWASSWSPDGRTLIAGRFEKTFDMIAIPMTDGQAGEPVVVVGTPAAELSGKISPDGRWLAYTSDESGQMQVFVRSMTGSGGRWQVSEGNGWNPHWIRDGNEIVYRNQETRQYYGVAVDTSTGAPKFARSRRLFESAEIDPPSLGGWDAGPTVDRFAFVIREQEAVEEVSSVVIVTDWFERLNKLVPGTAR